MKLTGAGRFSLGVLSRRLALPISAGNWSVGYGTPTLEEGIDDVRFGS